MYAQSTCSISKFKSLPERLEFQCNGHNVTSFYATKCWILSCTEDFSRSVRACDVLGFLWMFLIINKSSIPVKFVRFFLLKHFVRFKLGYIYFSFNKESMTFQRGKVRYRYVQQFKFQPFILCIERGVFLLGEHFVQHQYASLIKMVKG